MTREIGVHQRSKGPLITQITRITLSTTREIGVHQRSKGPLITLITFSTTREIGIHQRNKGPRITMIALSMTREIGVHQRSKGPLITRITLSMTREISVHQRSKGPLMTRIARIALSMTREISVHQRSKGPRITRITLSMTREIGVHQRTFLLSLALKTVIHMRIGQRRLQFTYPPAGLAQFINLIHHFRLNPFGQCIRPPILFYPLPQCRASANPVPQARLVEAPVFPTASSTSLSLNASLYRIASFIFPLLM
jgi:phage anti-repressor protein